MRIIRFILSIAAVLCLSFKLCFSACARAEYEIKGECCPMCAPGNHVYWHCSIDTSTTCIPCPSLTYTDEPNGLDKCFPCSVCEPSKGLRVKKTCIRSSDTVCEPLEGFYCIQKKKESCIFALEHSKCHPGQYIKQAGTAFTNIECGDCTEGSYSNGSFTTCRPHTKCETEGRTIIQPGTVSSDAICGNSSPVATIAGATAGVLIVIGIATVTTIYLKSKHKKTTTSETGNIQLPVQESAALQNISDSEATLPSSAVPLMAVSSESK